MTMDKQRSFKIIGLGRMECAFKTGNMNRPAFQGGTVGMNILFVEQLPAVGSDKYIYAVPGVNEEFNSIPCIRLYLYRNGWYAISDSRFFRPNSKPLLDEQEAKTAYWNCVNEITVAREVVERLIEEEADAADIAEAQATLSALEQQRGVLLQTWNAAKASAQEAETAAKQALDASIANVVEDE